MGSSLGHSIGWRSMAGSMVGRLSKLLQVQLGQHRHGIQHRNLARSMGRSSVRIGIQPGMGTELGIEHSGSQRWR